MRIKAITSLILSVLLVTSVGYANQVTYKISVTIPAIVGVNVPAETVAGEETLTLPQTQISSYMDVTTEEVIRNDALVLMRSFTVK